MMHRETKLKSSPSPRRLLLAVTALCLVFLALSVLVRRGEDIYYVRAPHLHVREQPSRSSSSSYILDRGDHVFLLGKEVQQGDLTWARVFVVYRPENAGLDRGLEGWIALSGTSSIYADRELNPIKKLIVLRNLYKWKTHMWIRHGVNRSRLLRRLRRVVPYAGDKLLHIFLVFLLGSVLFLVLALAFRISTAHAFLASVALINLLGFLNEMIDLLSGRGSFEIMDIVANALGSAGVILPLLVVLLWKRIGPITR